MARTNLPLTALAPNSSIAAPAGTNVDATNGMNVQIVTNGIPAAYSLADVFLQVTNSAASAKTVTVRAGSNPPAFRAGLGDLAVSVNASATVFIGPLESARFAQVDGSLNIDFGSGMTGTINAFNKVSRF